MCQGFNHFSSFLSHFVLAKLATSGIRVKVSNINIILEAITHERVNCVGDE